MTAAALTSLPSPRGAQHISRAAVSPRTAASTSTSTSTSTSRERSQRTANYERILGKHAPPDTLLTFAYGANLSAETLRTRGVSPSASLIARAPGYKVVFQHRGGYASLDPVEEEEDEDDEKGGVKGDAEEEEKGAYGVVHRISRSELALIRRWEIGYEMSEVRVVLQAPAPSGAGNAAAGNDGKVLREQQGRSVVTASVFVTKTSARLRAPVPPFSEYHAKIVSGARAVGLPLHYVATLMQLGDGAVPKARRGAEYFDLEVGLYKF
jgi:hypothetical protein